MRRLKVKGTQEVLKTEKVNVFGKPAETEERKRDQMRYKRSGQTWS